MKFLEIKNDVTPTKSKDIIKTSFKIKDRGAPNAPLHFPIFEGMHFFVNIINNLDIDRLGEADYISINFKQRRKYERTF